MQLTSGPARARRATALPGRTRSWWRAKGRQQSAASLLLDLAKFYEHVGHDHLWEEGHTTSFPRRLLASWCASCEGWRFLEADKCATFPFWAFGTILPGCSGATTAAKLMLATLLETVSSRLPTNRLWNVVDDISGHVAGSPRTVQVLTAEAARLLVEGLQARHLPLSKGKSKVLIDGTDKLKQGLLRQSAVLGIDESTRATFGRAGQARTPSLSRGDWAGQQGARSAPGSSRRPGTHSQSDSTGSNAGVLRDEVLGFTSTQLKAIMVDAAKAIYRPVADRLRGWPTPRRQRQTTSSGISSSPTRCAGLGDGRLGGQEAVVRLSHRRGRQRRCG